MQANSAEHFSIDSDSTILGATAGLVEANACLDAEPDQAVHEPVCFHGIFSSCMEMYADAQTVETYLNAHHGWFRRCAHPMQADPLGQNGYALTIGRFGSFGYEVEPKIGLDLLPQDQDGVYRIETIAIPGYTPPGYDVDFQAALHLVESDPAAELADRSADLPAHLTRVEWELDLKVIIQFPRFIHALPRPMIQKTGDRVLNQIVRQVSRCLTHKVQEDFHGTLNLSFPKKRKRRWGQA